MYDSAIQEIRDKIANRLLFSLSLAAIPAVIASAYRASDIGFQPAFLIHNLLSIVFVLAALFSQRLSYRMRASIVVGGMFVLSVTGFVNFVIAGAGIGFLFISIVLALVLFDRRVGIALMAGGAAVVALTGAGYGSGVLTPAFDLDDYIRQPAAWLSGVFVVALFGAAALPSVSKVIDELQKSLRLAAGYGARLSAEVAEKTRELMSRTTAAESAEEALRASDAFLGAIADNIPVAITYIDNENVVQFVNRLGAEWLARPKAEIVGRPFGEIVTSAADDLPEIYAVMSGRRIRANRRIAYPDGITRWVQISRVPDIAADGRVRGYFRVSVDISDRKETERALVEARDSLLDAVESVNHGIILYDAEDRIALINGESAGRWPEMAGMAKIGARFEDLTRMAVDRGFYVIPPGQTKEEFTAELMASHRRADGTWETQHLPDGRILQVSARRSRSGGIVVVGLDITEPSMVERKLRETAVESSRRKSEFLAHMSHEIRTPLNAIIGFSQMIRDQIIGPIGDARYRGYADDILYSAEHLLSVINNVLDLAKVEAGKWNLDITEVPVADLVGATCRLASARAAHEGVSIDVRPLPALSLLGDRRLLQQILLNLTINAIKYAGADRNVTIDCTATKDGGVEISVADSGPGMTTEDVERALRPFETASSVQSRRRQDTGLGLSLSRVFAELHDGTLVLESAPNRGTVVRVRLPAIRVRMH